jgi:hypothetical protein
MAAAKGHLRAVTSQEAAKTSHRQPKDKGLTRASRVPTSDITTDVQETYYYTPDTYWPQGSQGYVHLTIQKTDVPASREDRQASRVSSDITTSLKGLKGTSPRRGLKGTSPRRGLRGMLTNASDVTIPTSRVCTSKRTDSPQGHDYTYICITTPATRTSRVQASRVCSNIHLLHRLQEYQGYEQGRGESHLTTPDQQLNIAVSTVCSKV